MVAHRLERPIRPHLPAAKLLAHRECRILVRENMHLPLVWIIRQAQQVRLLRKFSHITKWTVGLVFCRWNYRVPCGRKITWLLCSPRRNEHPFARNQILPYLTQVIFWLHTSYAS